jgi:hypothetical protein
MNTYPIGTTVVLPVVFKDAVTLVLGDPTTVLLRVGDPTGAEVDYTVALGNVSHPSTGNYQATIAPRIPGIWRYRWEGKGVIVAASEGRFEVQPSLFRVLNLTHTSDTGRYAVTGSLATLHASLH